MASSGRKGGSMYILEMWEIPLQHKEKPFYSVVKSSNRDCEDCLDSKPNCTEPWLTWPKKGRSIGLHNLPRSFPASAIQWFQNSLTFLIWAVKIWIKYKNPEDQVCNSCWDMAEDRVRTWRRIRENAKDIEHWLLFLSASFCFFFLNLRAT